MQQYYQQPSMYQGTSYGGYNTTPGYPGIDYNAQLRAAHDQRAQLQYGANQTNMPQYGNMQQPMQQQPESPKATTVFVQNIEQARAYAIQLDGTRYVFVNTSNGELYTKCFDIQTGGDGFKIYAEKGAEIKQETATAESVQQSAEVNYAAQIADMLSGLNSRVEGNEGDIKTLQAELNKLKGELGAM